MARLTVLPHEDIIDGFKGSIDFYVHRGIPCARSWPKSPGKHRSLAVMAQWPAWSYIASAWRTLDADLRTYYERMASGTHMTGRDLFTRSYLSGAFTYSTGA